MKTNKSILAAAIGASILAAACSRPTANTNVAVITTSNANTTTAASNSNSNTAANTASGPEINMDSVSADSPAGAYKAAYTARKNKDIAGLKKIMSKSLLQFFGTMGKESKKSVDDMLKELCDIPQSDKAEARAEKITGDTATIEYKDADGTWQQMDFIKEDGIWKLTLGKDDEEDMKSDEAPEVKSDKKKG